MFKKENRIWWYLVGCLLIFASFLWLARDYMLPILTGKRGVIEETPFVYSTAPEMSINTSSTYQLKFTTSEGTFIVEMYDDSAPKNVNNLVFLVQEGYYNGTSLFRLIPDMLVQGGDRNTLDDDPNNDGKGGPGYLVPDEMNWDSLGLSEIQKQALVSAGYTSTPDLVSQKLEKFSMAMASAGVGTNGSQFFFVLAGNEDSRLADMQGFFTVVGKIIEGSPVLEKINTYTTRTDGALVRPETDIIIEKVEVLVK